MLTSIDVYQLYFDISLGNPKHISLNLFQFFPYYLLEKNIDIILTQITSILFLNFKILLLN